ncbi:uncharacterized protein LOC118439343 isoform X1 [Folsomia candida]|uniref:uncharacterized protein LOC118439343 isoform X1 n=1 Tax=Folsomia candida TaxID=158441 RepID=UPI001604E309|nr:uncharacterized protein LOC118439343 isoform X1 [Folsomia candida]
MTETKLDQNVQIISIPGYAIIRLDRTGGGGGLAVLYRNHHKCKIMQLAEMDIDNSKIEILTQKFQSGNEKSFMVSCLYRPKFILTNTDIDKFESIFHAHLKTGLYFYICGDYNIHLEDTHKSHIKKFNNVLNRLGLLELIQNPTRGKARLDLIISNDDMNINGACVNQPFISDHESTIIDRLVTRVPKKKRVIQFRSYRKMDTRRLAERVVEMDLEGLHLLTIDDACKTFIHKHIQLFDEYAPILTKSIRESSTPRHMSDDTKLLTINRNKLYEQHKKFPTHVTKTRLKILNAHINKMFKLDCRRKIDADISKNGVWKTKKQLFMRNQTNNQLDIDILNDFYAGVPNEHFDCVHPTKPSGLDYDAQFKFTKITTYDLIRVYNKLRTRTRTAYDSTGLAPIMLNYTIRCPNISNALTKLVNGSLMQEEFKNCVKTGSITPLPKIDSPTEPAHYRPVAVQPFLSLVIEKVAHSQIVKHFDDNNMLYRGQFGFRNRHSCETAMVAVTESI